MQHPELGRKILDRVAEMVNEVGRVEIFPKQDGRNMTMVLGPDKKAQAAAQKKALAEAQSETDSAETDTPDNASGEELSEPLPTPETAAVEAEPELEPELETVQSPSATKE